MTGTYKSKLCPAMSLEWTKVTVISAVPVLIKSVVELEDGIKQSPYQCPAMSLEWTKVMVISTVPVLIKSVVELEDGIKQSPYQFVVILFQPITNDPLAVQLVVVDFCQFCSQCGDFEQHLLTCVSQLALKLHNCGILMRLQLVLQPLDFLHQFSLNVSYN